MDSRQSLGGDGRKDKAYTKQVLRVKSLKRLHNDRARRGVVYISRIPPHMKPAKIKQLLSQHTEITKVYCAQEDPSNRRKRKRVGGNTGKQFIEGWVEFANKREAKRVVELLNGQPIGGRRRSAFHFDLWCLKYLSGFKWDNLTEEIAYEKMVKEQRMAAEISAAKRERDFYLSRVDRAKALQAIAARKNKNFGTNAPADNALEGVDTNMKASSMDEQRATNARTQLSDARPFRRYPQRQVLPDRTADPNAPVVAQDVLRMVVAKRRRAGTADVNGA